MAVRSRSGVQYHFKPQTTNCERPNSRCALSPGDGSALSAEAVSTALSPGGAERVVRHEAGHLLLAHVLGCPVQGCRLSAADALRGDGGGGANLGGAAPSAGTAFFDPACIVARDSAPFLIRDDENVESIAHWRLSLGRFA